jgi:hypothetical protein
MADTIARRLREPDKWLDDCLEPAADHARRAMWRAWARSLWSGASFGTSTKMLAQELEIPIFSVRRSLQFQTFGSTWAFLEKHSRLLQRRPVPVEYLERETEAAKNILDAIRIKVTLHEPADRSGTVTFSSSQQFAVPAAPAE